MQRIVAEVGRAEAAYARAGGPRIRAIGVGAHEGVQAAVLRRRPLCGWTEVTAIWKEARSRVRSFHPAAERRTTFRQRDRQQRDPGEAKPEAERGDRIRTIMHVY